MPAHPREVDDQAIIADAQTGPVMTPAAHGDQQIVFPAKVDRRDHVGGIDAARDEPGRLSIIAVVNFSGFVVLVVVRPDELPRRLALKPATTVSSNALAALLVSMTFSIIRYPLNAICSRST